MAQVEDIGISFFARGGHMESMISALHFRQSEYIDMELFLLGKKSRRQQSSPLGDISCLSP